jgi:CelD/BcsL family acetyltransferase involved in cellulose biosynthesis
MADEAGAAPFMRPGWFDAWAETFGKELEVVAVRTGSLRAIAPLVANGRTLAAPVNQETPGYALLAADPESRIRLAREILDRRPASVEMLRVSEADVEVLDAAARQAHFRVVKELMQRSPYISVDQSWEDYSGSLNKKFRKDLARRIRRLEEQGEMAIEVHDGTERLDQLLDQAFAIESLGWKGEQGTAIGSDGRTSSFYRAIARWAAERGWLRLWFLRIDGRAIAFCLDVDDGVAYYGLKVAHDPAHAKVSPGMILQDETIKYTFDRNLLRYEFLGTDEPYKLKWTKDCHDLIAWRAFSRGPRGRAAWFGRAVARPLARKLKKVSGGPAPGAQTEE